MTGEDDFNALASAVLQGNVEGRVYRLAPPQRSHGVVAPYTGAEMLFGTGITGAAVNRRYRCGARIAAQRSGDGLPAGHDVLFRIRADGRLAAVTEASSPAPQPGDTIVSLGPAPGS